MTLKLQRGRDEFDVQLVRTPVGPAHSAAPPSLAAMGRQESCPVVYGQTSIRAGPRAALSGTTLAEEVDAALQDSQPGGDEVGAAIDVVGCGW